MSQWPPDPDLELRNLHQAVSTSQMPLFVFSLQRLLFVLGSEKAIMIAAAQLRACLPILDGSNGEIAAIKTLLDRIDALSPTYRTTEVFLVPEDDFKSSISRVSNPFAHALTYLCDAVGATPEGLRVQSAHRAILHSIYTRFADYRVTHELQEIPL